MLHAPALEVKQKVIQKRSDGKMTNTIVAQGELSDTFKGAV